MKSSVTSKQPYLLKTCETAKSTSIMKTDKYQINLKGEKNRIYLYLEMP